MRKNEIKHKFYLGQRVKLKGEKEVRAVLNIKSPTTVDKITRLTIPDPNGIIAYRLSGSNDYFQEHHIKKVYET